MNTDIQQSTSPEVILPWYSHTGTENAQIAITWRQSVYIFTQAEVSREMDAEQMFTGRLFQTRAVLNRIFINN